MNKITADHLARRACVYIRQSTPEQVRHNLESKRRQYGLVDRARALGWQDIDVIDDDLGSRDPESVAPALSVCCLLCAISKSVPSSALRRRDWRARTGSGIRCWSFAASSASY